MVEQSNNDSHSQRLPEESKEDTMAHICQQMEGFVLDSTLNDETYDKHSLDGASEPQQIDETKPKAKKKKSKKAKQLDEERTI